MLPRLAVLRLPSRVRYHRANGGTGPRGAASDESGGTVVHGLIKRVRALTGVYGSGFASDSVMGVVLPFAVVALVGGLGALLVYLLN